jgi:hypothetical protein
MKWQYIVLAVILIGAAALSLWMATRVTVPTIEHTLTNTSGHEQEEGGGGLFGFNVAEGVNILMYLAIVAALFAIGIGAYVYISKRQ